MQGETKDIFKVVMWILLLVVLLTCMGFCGRLVSKRVESVEMTTSHQYREGRAESIAVFEAQLVEIEAQLATEQDESVRKILAAQRAALRVQLAAAQRK